MFLSLPAKFVLYLLAAAALLWPVVFNANYIFFYDTSAYLRYPSQAFRMLFGVETEWSRVFAPLTQTLGTGGAGSVGSVGDAVSSGNAVSPEPGGMPGGHVVGGTDTTVIGGRSIYYGVMLYAGALVAGLWSTVVVQFCCVFLALYMTLVSLFGRDHNIIVTTLVVLGLTTPLSFFIGYLMPDIFAGIAILAIANLFAFDTALPRWNRVVWFGLLAVSLMFHSSHTAIALLMLFPAIGVAWVVLRRLPWRATATVVVAICMALLSESVFFKTVEAVYGAPPMRPPFLMARVISDGPGYDYLAAKCPDVDLHLCAFLPRLPLDSDTFLWSQNPEVGVYGLADPATRRAFADEEMRFVLGVLAFDPMGQLAASFDGFLEQLRRFGLREFAYTGSLRDITLETLPQSKHAGFTDSAFYRDTFPLRPADVVVHLTVFAALGYMIWYMVSAIRGDAGTSVSRPEIGRAFIVFAIVLVGGVVANAAVTGVLSTPHERYQARVIWLVPLLAMIMFLRRKPGVAPVAKWRTSSQ